MQAKLVSTFSWWQSHLLSMRLENLELCDWCPIDTNAHNTYLQPLGCIQWISNKHVSAGLHVLQMIQYTDPEACQADWELHIHSRQSADSNADDLVCRLRWCHTDLGANILSWPRLIQENKRFSQLGPIACGLSAEHFDGVLAKHLVDSNWTVHHITDKCLYDHSPSPQVSFSPMWSP